MPASRAGQGSRSERCLHYENALRTPCADPMLVQCWTDVADGGPTLNQHWVGGWYAGETDMIVRDYNEVTLFSTPLAHSYATLEALNFLLKPWRPKGFFILKSS